PPSSASVRKRTTPATPVVEVEDYSPPPRAPRARTEPATRSRVPGAPRSRTPVAPPPEPEPEFDEFDEEYDNLDAEPEPEPEPVRPANKFASLRATLAAAAAQLEQEAGGAAAPPRPAPAPRAEPAPRPTAGRPARAAKKAAPRRPPAPPRRPAAPTAPVEAEEFEEVVDEAFEDEAPTTEFERPGIPEPAPEPVSTAPTWQTTSTPVTPSYTSPSQSPPTVPPPPIVRPAPGPTPSEPKERKGALKTILIIAAAAVAAAIVIVGILLLAGNDEGGVKYSDLKAGDCFETPSGRFNNVETVACSEQHDLEVYAVLDHPAAASDAFPGMDELVRYANPLCLAQFRAYAGVPFEQLSLSDKYITPRESAWKDGARRIVCVVGQSNEEPSNTSIRAAGS
ncbi:MAG: septum formation family protein, partial [Acidimicrobiales bacterium]